MAKKNSRIYNRTNKIRLKNHRFEDRTISRMVNTAKKFDRMKSKIQVDIDNLKGIIEVHKFEVANKSQNKGIKLTLFIFLRLFKKLLLI